MCLACWRPIRRSSSCCVDAVANVLELSSIHPHGLFQQPFYQGWRVALCVPLGAHGFASGTPGNPSERELLQAYLLPLQAEDFEISETQFCRVDGKGCVQVRTNWYSTPLSPSCQAHVRVWPTTVSVWYEGREVAYHPRCYGRRQQVLDLEHYLEVLERKPGALAGSTPLAQWRAAGRWTAVHDRFWSRLLERHGQPAGTRLMIELLQQGREWGYERLTQALEQALACGVHDAGAVRYLLRTPPLDGPAVVPLAAVELAALPVVTRPLPTVTGYDQLLSGAVADGEPA